MRDRVGEIDYVVSQADGPAGVIGVGGFLGLGEYTVAISLEEFTLQDSGNFILPMDKEALKSLPEFDESGVEGLPDETPIAELMTDSPSMDAPAAEPTAPVVTN